MSHVSVIMVSLTIFLTVWAEAFSEQLYVAQEPFVFGYLVVLLDIVRFRKPSSRMPWKVCLLS